MYLFDLTVTTTRRYPSPTFRIAFACDSAYAIGQKLKDVIEGGDEEETVERIVINGVRELAGSEEHDEYLTLDMTTGTHHWLRAPIPQLDTPRELKLFPSLNVTTNGYWIER